MHPNCPCSTSVKALGCISFHPCCRHCVLSAVDMLCLVSRECVCLWAYIALRKRLRHSPCGGFGVILKTGYRDDGCWIDKSTEYTETGNRLLVLPMQRRWKTAYAWLCKMLAKRRQSFKMYIHFHHQNVSVSYWFLNIDNKFPFFKRKKRCHLWKKQCINHNHVTYWP